MLLGRDPRRAAVMCSSRVLRFARSGEERLNMHMKRAISLFSVLLINLSDAAIPDNERNALVEIFQQTHGENWVHNDNWCYGGPCSPQQSTNSFNAPGTECTWYGVKCDALEQHVTGLQLNLNNLLGTLPASVESLCSVALFNVRWNTLSGELPPLTCATGLQIYLADGNAISGGLPPISSHIGLVGICCWEQQNYWPHSFAGRAGKPATV